ncbi:hypothetical protein tb265_44970 [Gemmatimonadetes bacterium T265]|nr:hypothetical protein tb265_44970 [Gemmatimonadetes bacterium T265]
MPRTRHARYRSVAGLALLLAAPAARAQRVVNIDAMLYGFAYPTDPAPTVGQLISPFSLAPDRALNQLTLDPGTYRITNAAVAGLAGANAGFTGWRYNSDANWVWNFVVADDATNRVVYYGDAGYVSATQQGIASLAAVQGYRDTFTLAGAATLDFMVRDYYLPDNAGGVSVAITPVTPATTAPEPATWALVGAGLACVAGLARRRVAAARGRPSDA